MRKPQIFPPSTHTGKFLRSVNPSEPEAGGDQQAKKSPGVPGLWCLPPAGAAAQADGVSETGTRRLIRVRRQLSLWGTYRTFSPCSLRWERALHYTCRQVQSKAYPGFSAGRYQVLGEVVAVVLAQGNHCLFAVQ